MTQFFRDLNGALILRGRCAPEVHESSWSYSTALPSWLTSDAGTNSVVTASAGRPYLQGLTTAGASNRARIKGTNASAASIAAADFSTIWWELESLRFDTNDAGAIAIKIGLDNGDSETSGVAIYQGENDNVATLKVHGGATQSLGDLSLRATGEGTNRRNIGLLAFPGERLVAVMEGDVVRHEFALPSMGVTAWVPSLMVTNKNAVAHHFRVSRARLTLRW